jgi:fatty acid desaturase
MSFPARELAKAVAKYESISPWPGLLRTTATMSLFLALTYVTFNVEHLGAYLGCALLSSLVFFTLMATTHDGMHRTLTGITWFDELFPRLISYPVFHPHGTYGELHKIHHSMNGANEDDPERLQWTEEEYNKAGKLGRWYARNLVWVNIILGGGIGLIFRFYRHGFKYSKNPKIRLMLWTDVLGIVAVNTLIYSVVYANDFVLEYFLFYLVIEKVVGGILSLRAHVEHYGLWGKRGNFYETQVHTCRNIETSRLVSWYFNGLNFHSIHHAFPRIPFYNLREAHKSAEEVLQKHGLELPTERLYSRSLFKIIANPQLISSSTTKRG